MGDRAAKGAVGGAGRIDMDELVVVGGVGEGIDHRLIDDDPIRKAGFRADQPADIRERDFLDHQFLLKKAASKRLTMAS